MNSHPMSNIDKQALRQLAVDAKELAIIKRYTKGIEAQKKFIAEMTPATVLALLDELEAAEKRIAELEAREVTLPAQKYCPGEYAGSVLWSETEVWNQAISECAKAIRVSGIGKGE